MDFYLWSASVILFFGFGAYLIGKLVILNPKMLNEKGDWVIGVNLPSLNLKNGETLNRIEFVIWTLRRVLEMFMLMMVATLIYLYVYFNLSFEKDNVFLIFLTILLLIIFYSSFKLLQVKKLKHLFIMRDDDASN